MALRAALEGLLNNSSDPAPPELAELVKAQLESVQEWGWPPIEHVDLYVRNSFRGGLADLAVHRNRR